MAVIDANVVVVALVGADDEQSSACAAAVADAYVVDAPGHFVSEVLGTIRWLAAGKRISWDLADAAVIELKALSVQLHAPTAEDVERAWQLRHNLVPQDALYLALAERLDAAFITQDDKIARSNQPRCPIFTPAHWLTY